MNQNESCVTASLRYGEIRQGFCYGDRLTCSVSNGFGEARPSGMVVTGLRSFSQLDRYFRSVDCGTKHSLVPKSKSKNFAIYKVFNKCRI